MPVVAPPTGARNATPPSGVSRMKEPFANEPSTGCRYSVGCPCRPAGRVSFQRRRSSAWAGRTGAGLGRTMGVARRSGVCVGVGVGVAIAGGLAVGLRVCLGSITGTGPGFAFGVAFADTFGVGRTGVDACSGCGVAATTVGAVSATSSRSISAGATLVTRGTGLADSPAATGALPAGTTATSATLIPRNATNTPTTTDCHQGRTNPMHPMVGSRQYSASGLNSTLWTVRQRPQRLPNRGQW